MDVMQADTGGSPAAPPAAPPRAPQKVAAQSSAAAGALGSSLDGARPRVTTLTEELCSRCTRLRERGLLDTRVHVTQCMLVQHCSEASCYLVAGNSVYDATQFLSQHPGGASSILKRSKQNVDCAMDLSFHSAAAKKLWKMHRIGKLVKCGEAPQGKGCTIM